MRIEKVVEMKGKGFKLKENMFPMMVLKKLSSLSSDNPLDTQSFFEEFDKTNNLAIHVQLKNPDKWKLDSVRLRLRQMQFRGLVKRINLDQWVITSLGEIKLQHKKKKIGV